MPIRDDKAASFIYHDFLGVTRRYSHLIHRIGDFLTRCKLRQINPVVRPVVAGVQFNQRPSGLTVCQQLHSNRLRANAVLVFRVVPHLHDRCFGLFRLMGVRQHRDCAVHAGVGQFVALGQLAFRPGVPDLLSVRVLRQVADRRCPVVGLVQLNGCTTSHAVCIQLHGDSLRALAVLVVRVVPHLLDRCFGGLGGVAVRHVHAVHNSGVAGHCFFRDSVLDLSTGFVLGQRCENPAPVIRGRHLNGTTYDLAIGQQRNVDRTRPLAVLVVRIFPGLAAGHLDGFRFVRVRQRRNRAIHAGVGQLVALGQLAFRPAVNDLLAIRVLRQVLDLRCPVVGLVQRHFHAVGQDDLQLRRSLAVLVVSIVPHLLDRCFGLFRLVGVRQRRNRAFGAIAGQLVALGYLAFRPGVGDFHTARVLRQVLHLRCPVIAFVQLDFRTVGQGHGQNLRTLAVLVLLVVPHLLDRCFGLFRLVGVRQRRNRAFGNIASQLVTRRQLTFRPGVVDFHAARVLRQVVDRRCPAVGLVQRHFRAVGQGHGQRLRTLAILVVRVVPGLLDRRFGLFRLVGVRDNKAVLCDSGDLRLVALDLILRDRVDNLGAVGILGQV